MTNAPDCPGNRGAKPEPCRRRGYGKQTNLRLLLLMSFSLSPGRVAPSWPASPPQHPEGNSLRPLCPAGNLQPPPRPPSRLLQRPFATPPAAGATGFQEPARNTRVRQDARRVRQDARRAGWVVTFLSVCCCPGERTLSWHYCFKVVCVGRTPGSSLNYTFLAPSQRKNEETQTKNTMLRPTNKSAERMYNGACLQQYPLGMYARTALPFLPQIGRLHSSAKYRTYIHTYIYLKREEVGTVR